MGWESARRRPSSGLPGGAFVKNPPPPPRPEPEAYVPSAEEIETCMHYAKALRDLATEDVRFRANLTTYLKWDHAQCIKWIYTIEQQALDEKDTIGIHVVARVVINRLES